MKRRILSVILICSVCVGLLSGCMGKKEEGTAIESSETIVEEAVDAEGKGLRVEEDMLPAEAETQEWVEESAHENRLANVVLQDEEFIYFCGWEHILKWSNLDGSSEKIWISDKEHIGEYSYMYSYERGILIEDKLYFIERWQETPQNPLAPGTVQALSVVNTDGSGYRMIEKISDGEEAQLVLMDGVLYYCRDMETKALKGYVVGFDGELMDIGQVVNEPANLPKGFKEISYYNNGTRMLTAVESAYHFGYYLLWDEEYELCVVDQNTGEKTSLFDKVGNAAPVSFNKTHFLFRDYTNDFFYLINNRTWENDAQIYMDEDVSIIGMDDEYIYWQRYDDNMERYIYERVTLDGITTEYLFELSAFIGMPDDSPWYLMDISVVGDFIYYVGEQDFKYYLKRMCLLQPAYETVLGDAFFDTGIRKVGSISAYRENIFSETNPELILGETDVEWLVIDERFPGAAKINAILDAEQQANMDYTRNIAKDMEEWAEEGMNSSISSRVSPIFFFNERFISFTQQGYEYSGGAHGMPYWVPHTFDLHTGEELDLSFFVTNEEGVFKDIVMEQFIKMYDVDPDLYWDDAIDIVRECVSLQSPFYLKEDGLVIYFGPYDLAPYAAGFVEIVVPYDKLELSVPIEN